MTPRPIGEGLVMGVSGVRGKVGEGLVPEVMVRLAACHGSLLSARARASGDSSTSVIVGRDSRPSGLMLRDAACAGLASVGCDVLDVGLCPTPTLLLAVAQRGALGGMAITASHNPAEWNAAKLVSARGLFLDPVESGETLSLFRDADPARVGWDRLGRVSRAESPLAAHVQRILEAPEVDAGVVRRRGFRVVLDVCHGVGALLLEPLLSELGCRTEVLHGEPTGRFPRDPEPVPENLVELAGRVRESGADLGLAVDPDCDRLALVSGEGEPVGEDLTLALAARRVLAARSGPVVTNLSTSRVVEDAAAATGSRVVRAPVGEIHVVRRALELASPISGEGNGGVIYPAVHPTRDAGAAAALVLSFLAGSRRSLGEAVAELPRYVILKERVLLSGTPFDPGRVAALFPDVVPDLTDGVRFEWPARRAWLHVRASGTEPIARVIAEAPTADEARAIVARARDGFATSGRSVASRS